MYNDKEKISANEINKYCYCQYSWYYERLYGRKYIREKYKNKSEKSNFKKLDYKITSNFERGRDFHDDFLLKHRKKIFIKYISIILIIISIILLIWGLKLCGIL